MLRAPFALLLLAVFALVSEARAQYFGPAYGPYVSRRERRLLFLSAIQHRASTVRRLHSTLAAFLVLRPACCSAKRFVTSNGLL